MIKTVNEISREWINKASVAARKLFRDAVKPIYGATIKGYADHIGSALLLRLPEGHFLLTAAHVIAWNKSTTLYIPAAQTLKALPQFDFVTTAPDGDRNKDHGDFAIVRLHTDFVAKLLGAKFITEAEISCSAAQTEGRTYTCLGYPNSKNKIDRHKGTKITPSLLPYTSAARPARLLKKASNDLHILVDYNAKHTRDESGAKVSTLALRGCSGGAIIDVGRISIDTLNADFDPKLAALRIEGHQKEKVILGTRLGTILNSIRKHMQATGGPRR